MRMYAVTKGNSYRNMGMVQALFKFRDDAENFIKERMIESMPSDLLDFDKAETLEIENDYYIERIDKNCKLLPQLRSKNGR